MLSLSCEISFLLACMRFYFGTATERELLELPKPDWDDLIQTAIAHGVMPLLYQALKSPQSNIVPQSHLVQLQHLYRLNGLHNISQTKELLRILDRLQASGIAAMTFKGSVLAASAYGNVSLRQFNDFDILVRQQEFWQAKTMLAAQGYQLIDSERLEAESFHRYLQISLLYRDAESMMLNRHFQPSWLHSNEERSLDLHWGIPPRRVWNLQQFEQLWQNPQTIELMGQAVQTFSPEATLVIQCINVAKEPWKRSFKQMCDVAQIVQTHPRLVWEDALKLASRLHSQRLFLIGLSVTRELLNFALPEAIVTRLPALSITPEQIFQSEPDLKPTFWMEYSDQLKTLDRPWDALLITLLYLRIGIEQIMRLLLTPNQRDRDALPLPTKLFFLYYLFRPFRLLATYGLTRSTKYDCTSPR